MTKDFSDSKTTGYHSEPVAIIGLSCLFPGAENRAEYWAAIKKSLDALSDIPADHWAAADYYDPDPKAEDKTYGRRGGFLSPVPFEPLKYGIVPKDLSAIDTTQLLGLVAADLALADAGYAAGRGLDHSRTAVLLGVTGALKMVVSLGSRLAHPQLRRALADSGVEETTAAEVLKRFANEFTPWQENSFPGLLGNVTAGRVANRLNLGGSNLVVDAACASSLAAVRQGLMELASGQADLVVTGGVDTFSDPFMYTCFSKTPALSPTGEVRAYDQDGDGTMLGEGVGIVVLKRLSEARQDGDRIYAVIRGVGSSSDGRGAAIFAPTAEGQVRAMQNAYDQAGFTPRGVELVEGHGTGTAVGDAVEVMALNEIFSRDARAESGRPWCALGSVKSQIGHTKAAAGAAGLIKAALALYLKSLPPSVKVKNPLPVLTAPGSPFHLSTRPRPWLSAGPRRAGVSAFGFGGSNFHCLLEEASPDKPLAEAPLDFDFFAFSGPSPAALAEALNRAMMKPREAAPRSRAGFSPADPHRLIILASVDDFPEMARLAASLLSGPDPTAADWPATIFYGQGPVAATELGFFCPGPERARQDMYRELALDWPPVHRALNEAARQWAETSPNQPPMNLLLYPPDLASADNRRAWAEAFAKEAPRALALRAAYQGVEEVLARFALRPTAVISELDGPVNLAAELQAAALWIDLGPGGGQSALLNTLGPERLLALEGDCQGLARLLARLAALGLALDLTAWPRPPLEAAPADEEQPGRSFSMTISGANQFTKEVIPPSPRREEKRPAVAAPQPASPAPARPQGSSPAEALEALAAETARLHQEFLQQQAETLRLLSQSLGAPQQAETLRLLSQSLGAEAVPALPAAEPPRPEAAHAVPRASEATEEAVLRVVADETGYPLTMLNLDMDLEADLGLDSIKKVEIMAELSEKMPGVQGLGAESMSQAATLRDLVALAAVPASASYADYASAAYQPVSEAPPRYTNGHDRPVAAPAPAEAEASTVWALLREVVAAETGYPQNMLSPSMRLADDLGLDSIRLVEIASLMSEKLPEAGAAGAELVHEAHTLGDLAQALEGQPAYDDVPAPAFAAAPGAAQATATEVILETVSRETGYPRDMLALHMNLEADLGLDSIKKVEIMAALSEQLPELDNLATAEVMSGLETLGDLAALAGDSVVAEVSGSVAVLPIPAPTPVAAPPVAAPASDVAELLLEVVAAETGYPQDMLRFDAALEADLGLDSIKRVEIMAALSEKLGDDRLDVASAESLHGAVTLGDLATLLSGAQPEAAVAPVATVIEAPPQKRRPGRPPKNVVSDAPKRKVGRPRKSSLPPAPIEAPTIEPITTAVTAFQVELAPVAEALSGRTSFALSPGARALVLAEADPTADALVELLTAQGQRPERLDWAESGRLASEAGFESLFLVWPGPKSDLNLPRRAFQALKAAAPTLLKAAGEGRQPLVMGLSFLGGDLGFSDSGKISAPSAGALGGLLKTAAREWPGLRVRAVDLPVAAYGPGAAEYLASLPAAADMAAPVEIAITAPGRLMTPRLAPYRSQNIRVRHLREAQTVLVTGGARGVTAAVLKELARAYRPRLVILGRSPLPAEEPYWLKNLSEESAVRQALFDRAERKPSPKELAGLSAAVMAGREIRDNLAVLERAGAKVFYHSGDFLRPEVVRATVAEIKRRHGPIHGFIHGAGVLADSLIVDKSEEDFDRVFDTKARLAEWILAELTGQPVNFVAFFSSSTARFGRRGQADYAAGNEVLNKLAQALSSPGNRQAPKCLAVNWGPWAGGMVDKGLSRLFESEGVGLIPLAEGARLFAGLAGGPKNDPVELVVLGPDTDMEALT